MSAAFQVERSYQFLRMNNLQCILHEHDYYGLHPRPAKCENTIDLSEHRERVVLEVGHVLRQYPHECLKFRSLHRLQDELVVVAEEEKAPAFTSTLTSIEYLLAIYRWAQAQFEKE